MNKIFRTVWNHHRRQIVVVNENTTSHSQATGSTETSSVETFVAKAKKTLGLSLLAAILPVVGSHVHAQKRRVVLLLQGLDAGFRDFQLVHQSDGNATRRRAVFLVLAGRFGLRHGFVVSEVLALLISGDTSPPQRRSD